jgi:hypothetical protein
MPKMCKPAYRIVGAICALFVAAGCVSSDKSENPLAPSVAGPIPGVLITAPTPIVPVYNARVSAADQPVLFEIENATSSGVRPLSYRFELAADSAFNTRLHERQGIQPGEGGRTGYRLTDMLAADRSYYWRMKAEDGANDGPFTPPLLFRVYTPVVFGAPTPISPTGNISTLQPVFVIGNAPKSGPAGRVFYAIEVADNNAFAPTAETWYAEESSSQTRLGSPIQLPANKQLFWRTFASDETTRGPVSAVQSFRTPASAPPAPPPPPPPGGGGGGSPLDQLDLSQVTWLHQNVSSWPVTSTVTDVTITHDTVCVYHTGAGSFPQSPFGEIIIEGNVWIFARINGRWYGATWDWLRVGQVCKGARAEEFGRDQIRIPPMDASWRPRAGDQIGFMMSSRARDGVPAGQVRSNVRMVTWPY